MNKSYCIKALVGGGVFLAGIIWVDIPWYSLTYLSIFEWLVLVGLGGLIFLVLSFQFRATLAAQGLMIKFSDAFYLSASNTFLNNILPLKAGLALRGLYLKNQYGFELKQYTNSMVSLMGLAWLAWLCLLLLSFFVIDLGQKSNYLDLNSLLIALFVFLGGGLFYWFGIEWLNRRFFTSLLQPSVKVLLEILVWAVLFSMISAGRLYLCAAWVDFDIEYIFALQLILVSSLTLVFSITPGNIGVKEGLLLLLSAQYGLDLGQMAVVLLLDRAAAYIAILFLGGGSMWVLAGNGRQLERQK